MTMSRHLSDHCPTCDSTNIEGDSVDIDGSGAMQDVYCTECGTSWTDIYTFESRTNVEVAVFKPNYHAVGLAKFSGRKGVRA